MKGDEGDLPAAGEHPYNTQMMTMALSARSRVILFTLSPQAIQYNVYARIQGPGIIHEYLQGCGQLTLTCWPLCTGG